MKESDSNLVIRKATVITLGEQNRVLPDHTVSVKGNRIASLVRDSDYRPSPADRVIDGTHKILLPGFINAHTHFYSTFARGLTRAAPSKDFQEILRNLWWRLDRKLTLDDVYTSALVACIDGIRHGTTTFIDHHASPHAAKGSLKKIADAVLNSGVRASLCYELSDRDGPKVATDGIEENVEFMRHLSFSGDDRLRALFGMHASFTVGESTLSRAVSAAKEFGAGFHIHTAEDLSDQKFAEEHFNCRVVERLYRAGILGDRTICAHGTHLNAREMKLLAETRTAVVHNPQSNMNNAVGVAPILKLIQAGVLVGLGTDAMTANMMEELRSAVWIRHLSEKDPSAGFGECVTTLLRNNALIASRYWPEGIGEIEEGFEADLALIDYIPPTPMTSDNFFGHLVFGISQGVVDTTIVGGKVLMEGKKLVTLDEVAVAEESRRLAAAFWERF